MNIVTFPFPESKLMTNRGISETVLLTDIENNLDFVDFVLCNFAEIFHAQTATRRLKM